MPVLYVFAQPRNPFAQSDFDFGLDVLPDYSAPMVQSYCNDPQIHALAMQHSGLIGVTTQ